MHVVVVGNGIAGRARFRMYRQNSEFDVQHVSRRTQDIFDASWDVPKDSLVHVCTENASHFDIVQFFLVQKLCHVCVEYPLANRVSEVRELFDLAKKHQRILHCSFISLLTDYHSHLKTYVFEHRERIRKVEVYFNGGMRSWLIEEHRNKNWGVLASSRIMSLVDLFGDLQVLDVFLEPKIEAYRLKVVFLVENITIELNEYRSVGGNRSKEWYIDGQKIEKIPQEQSLFELDNAIFHNMIHKSAQTYVSEDKIIEISTLTEQIQAIIKKKSQSD
jgi:hypothetical protein